MEDNINLFFFTAYTVKDFLQKRNKITVMIYSFHKFI